MRSTVHFFNKTCLYFSCLLLSPLVQSYEQPAVNLGFTSFLDGGPPAGKGLYFTEYLQFYTADDFTNRHGDSNTLFPEKDPDLDVWVALSQFIYMSDQKVLFDGKWGAEIIIPYVNLDLKFDDIDAISDNSSGLGDIVVSPFLQWDPIMGENGPLFMHRIEFEFIVPTGKYNSKHSLNPGSNFFSFNPYWAATLFITPRLTASTRIHYLWNAKNNSPSKEAAPTSPFFNARDVQAGQAMHGNFAVAYEVIANRLRLGLNGYYFKQISNTEVNGHEISGTKEQVLGIGPGMVYHFSKHDHLFFNSYFETAAENRTEGVRLNLRFTHHF